MLLLSVLSASLTTKNQMVTSIKPSIAATARFPFTVNTVTEVARDTSTILAKKIFIHSQISSIFISSYF